MAKREMYLINDTRYLLRDTSNALWESRKRIDDEHANHNPIRSDERDALNPLLNKGYEIVGHGIGRIVLRFPGELDSFVVKIGRYGNEVSSIGMNQNLNEILLYEKTSQETQLLPVLDWQEANPRWIVMPYGEPIEGASASKKENWIEEIQESVSHLGCLRGEELNEKNIVKWGGDVYLSDYGSTTPPWV